MHLLAIRLRTNIDRNTFAQFTIIHVIVV